MNKKVLTALVFIIILAVPAFVFTRFTLNCNSQYNAARKSKQPLIDEFDKIALLGEQPPQKAKVQRAGDCIDSRPSATVSKMYTQTMNGGQAVDSIRTGLKTAGYSITNENFGSEGCKLLYRVQARHDNVKIQVVAFHKNIKDPTCTDGYPTGISEDHFRSQDIDTVELHLG